MQGRVAIGDRRAQRRVQLLATEFCRKLVHCVARNRLRRARDFAASQGRRRDCGGVGGHFFYSELRSLCLSGHFAFLSVQKNPRGSGTHTRDEHTVTHGTSTQAQTANPTTKPTHRHTQELPPQISDAPDPRHRPGLPSRHNWVRAPGIPHSRSRGGCYGILE